jgi:FMN-dependent NADH-azoreductase
LRTKFIISQIYYTKSDFQHEYKAENKGIPFIAIDITKSYMPLKNTSATNVLTMAYTSTSKPELNFVFDRTTKLLGRALKTQIVNSMFVSYS